MDGQVCAMPNLPARTSGSGDWHPVLVVNMRRHLLAGWGLGREALPAPNGEREGGYPLGASHTSRHQPHLNIPDRGAREGALADYPPIYGNKK